MQGIENLVRGKKIATGNRADESNSGHKAKVSDPSGPEPHPQAHKLRDPAAHRRRLSTTGTAPNAVSRGWAFVVRLRLSVAALRPIGKAKAKEPKR